ncbi:kinase-like domain-containing protein, partial [Phlebopus sp. FC_14]
MHTIPWTTVISRLTQSLRRELGIWKRLNHPNIVPFLGTASGFGPHTSLVSMWMPHGTLQSFLTDHDDQLSIADRFHLLRDIAAGIKYLHDLSVIHGDLTSRNVLIDEHYHARLMDFGYSSAIGVDALAYLQWSTRRPGAIRWAAPEQVQLMLQSWKSDIYSFGCLMLQVLSGKEPWSEIENIIHIVILLANGDNPRRPASRAIADEHWEFIQKCW